MPYDRDKFRPVSSGRIPAAKIIKYIEDNFEYKTRRDGKEYVINNPLNGDTGFHFNINPDKGVCHDWRGDEWAGPINPESNKRNVSFIKFIRLYKKCSYTAAIKEIMGTAVDLRDYLNPENRSVEASASAADMKLPTGVSPLAIATDRQALSLIKWLKSRGYDDESIAKSDLQYMGMDVYWPYFEFDSLVYWQSRSRLNKRFNFPANDFINESGARIRTSGSKGDYLYGFDDVEAAKYVIITEAIFDKHSVGDQSVASGGAVLTENQLKKLKIIGPKDGVILAPDNDAAGLKSVIANAKLLEQSGFKVYYSIPPDLDMNVKDWNECITKANLSRPEVRTLLDKGIKKYTLANAVKLHSMIK